MTSPEATAHLNHQAAGVVESIYCHICATNRASRRFDAEQARDSARKRWTPPPSAKDRKGGVVHHTPLGDPGSCTLPYPKETITRTEWEQQQHGQDTP